MIKVTTYINTIGSQKYNDFINQPFNYNVLYPLKDNVPKLFDGWRGKDNISWVKFTNDDSIVLEFYANEYIIYIPKPSNKYTLPLPLTINDFINTMNVLGIQLYWGDIINEQFEPKEYLHKDEIRGYFTNLLTKMGKSHELL